MRKISLSGELDTRVVTLNGKELSPEASQKLINHSPDGFAWGYGGSGPAQLALAICLEIYPEPKALAYYQIIKETLVAQLPGDNSFTWSIWIDEDEPLVFFEEPPIKSFRVEVKRIQSFVVQGMTPGDALRKAAEMDLVKEGDVILKTQTVEEYKKTTT